MAHPLPQEEDKNTTILCWNYMALHQIENPPEHRDTAPEGEIRQEPIETLLGFTSFIATAFALPAMGMAIAGFESDRESAGIIGLVLLLAMGVVNFVILFQIMKSRQLDPSETAPH